MDKMQAMEIKEILEINDTDFTILRFLNRMGSLPVSSIAKRSGLNRTTIFSATKRLKKRGLIYEIPQKGITFFAISGNDSLERQARNKLKMEEHKFHKVLEFTRLLSMERDSFGVTPKVAFFEGEEGIINLFQYTLKKNVKQKVFLTLDTIPPKILHFLKTTFIEQKKENNVYSQVIIPFSKNAHLYSSLDRKDNRETRFIPKDSFFSNEIIITKDSLALIDYKEGGLGVLMESQNLAKTFSTIFDIAWSTAKKSSEV